MSAPALSEPSPPLTAADWVKVALSARATGAHADALQAFQQALVLVPDHPLLPIDIANALLALDRVDESLALLQTHVEKFPDAVHAYVGLGHHARRAGDHAAALAHFQHALTLAPEHPSIPLDVAAEEETLGRVDDALGTLNAALARHPDSDVMRREVRRLRRKAGRATHVWSGALAEGRPDALWRALEETLGAAEFGEADGLLVRAETFLPNHARLWWYRGRLAKLRGDSVAARAAFTAGMEADPTATECYLGAFWAAMEQCALDEAQEVVTRGARLCADRTRVALMDVHLRRARGELDDALQIARDTQALAPTDAEAVVLCTELLWQQGRGDEAQTMLQSFPVQASGAAAEKALHRARLSMARFRLDEVLDAVAEAEAEATETPELLHLKTRAQIMLGDIEGARASIDAHSKLLQIRGLPPSHPEVVGGFHRDLMREHRANPFACRALEAARTLPLAERPAAHAEALLAEPGHLGTALALLVTLRRIGALVEVGQKNASGRDGVRSASQKIPAKIVQYWDQPEIPDDVLRAMLSWPRHCLGFEHQIFNDASAHAFIRRESGAHVAKAYRQANHPAMRADIFRLAYLARHGGIYADADDLCRRSIRDLLATGSGLIVQQEDLGSIGNNFLAAEPGHPLICAALETVVTNVLQRQGEVIWFVSGPGALTVEFCRLYRSELAATRVPDGVQVIDFYALQRHLSMHLPQRYKSTAQHWSSPEAAPLPLFTAG